MRVFTHRSFAARPTHVFEDSPEDPSPDNEQFSHVPLSLQCVCAADDLLSQQRLEHVGDQVLGLIVTDLLQSQFPYLRVGPSTVRITHCLISTPSLSVSDNETPPPSPFFSSLCLCRKCGRSSLAIAHLLPCTRQKWLIYYGCISAGG
jgi:hypothetical protein